jgi:hypothetical protein
VSTGVTALITGAAAGVVPVVGSVVGPVVGSLVGSVVGPVVGSVVGPVVGVLPSVGAPLSDGAALVDGPLPSVGVTVAPAVGVSLGVGVPSAIAWPGTARIAASSAAAVIAGTVVRSLTERIPLLEKSDARVPEWNMSAVRERLVMTCGPIAAVVLFARSNTHSWYMNRY